MRAAPLLIVAAVAGAASACARQSQLAPATTCASDDAVCRAIEGRVAELRERGGDCLAYGQVLERTLTSGRLVVRPYMWRVGPNLASAQATPGGEIAVAREIDPLNVGVRTLDDVLRSAEHEAVHLAFRIPSGEQADEAVVDRVVNACRSSYASRGTLR